MYQFPLKYITFIFIPFSIYLRNHKIFYKFVKNILQIYSEYVKVIQGGIKMIESYIDLIKTIDNSFDGIMVVDENLIVRYCRYFSASGLGSVDVKTAIGKTPLDIFANIDQETSTFYRAVKYGETILNNTQIIIYANGKKEPIVDSTIPIIADGKIIGAVNTVRFVSNFKKNNFTNHSNILAPCSNELYSIEDIIGASEEIINLKNKISKVSRTNSNIFIHGETGTGKEMVAQSIHSNSARKNKIFISQNCAAIPDNLLESILFGTTKGSYTDAINRPGIFEMADGGTIFLDEINSMNLNMQAKLLRIIEDKKITRIGGIETKEVDVRIIAAINQTPEACLAEKRIRPDLFYRLSSVQIKTPSLTERKNDIEKLAQFFIEFYNKKMNMNISDISKNVLDLFYKYPWPGNVRELKNVIETAFNFTSSNTIELDDVPDYILTANNKPNHCNNSIYKSSENESLNTALENFEKNYIIEVSQNTSSFSELADALKISRQLLNHKIKKYDLKKYIHY